MDDNTSVVNPCLSLLSHPGFINSIKCTNMSGRGTKPMKENQPHPKCGNGERQKMKALFLSITQLFCWF